MSSLRPRTLESMDLVFCGECIYTTVDERASAAAGEVAVVTMA